ncbi:polysaccharide lyase [Streptomyces formicae]|uniref:Heparin lyase I family protein n=1 Tax=Streptomyces formicae TaxID=1616117 RepID=A0ABY3WK30_9ACTN|nr:polysaccharide lyase [Streptomyces formicae]UNM12959.1 heparin lyase I family protein [Streptomyces formicae]
MQRRSPRSRLLLTSAAIASTMTLVTASPASASVLWDGNADKGLGVFAAILCDGGVKRVHTWGDSHGTFFEFNKVPGIDRCEGHSLAGAEGELQNNRTLWFGWSLATKTGNAQTVFQWKSNGTNDQHQQNYPVIMKVEDNKLKAWYVSPGETWNAIGSREWKDGWHAIQMKITTSSGTGGSVEIYLDGDPLASRSGIRTWDDLGNKPRWGTYGSSIASVGSQSWVDDPKMGTTRADVD